MEKRRLLLRRIDIFADLTDREVDTILDVMRERAIPRGTIVFHQHDSGGGLYLILGGSVKITRSGRDGREVTVAVLNEGNFFGEMSLLDGQPRSASATALQAARLLVLDREHFQRYVLAQPRIVAKLLRELSKRLRGGGPGDREPRARLGPRPVDAPARAPRAAPPAQGGARRHRALADAPGAGGDGRLLARDGDAHPRRDGGGRADQVRPAADRPAPGLLRLGAEGQARGGRVRVGGRARRRAPARRARSSRPSPP